MVAIRSAASNWLGLSHGKSSGFEDPGPLRTLEPRATWLINSTPQASPTSMVPDVIRAWIRLLACWPDPHWVSTVVAAVV